MNCDIAAGEDLRHIVSLPEERKAAFQAEFLDPGSQCIETGPIANVDESHVEICKVRGGVHNVRDTFIRMHTGTRDDKEALGG